MLDSLAFRRPDGTLVAVVNGLPYHIIPGDPHWDAAQEMAAELGDALPMEPPPPLPPPAPPPTLTARQLRLGLLALGVTRAQVEAVIAGIPDDTAREAALIEWEYATTYQRDHILVAQICAALGFAVHDIDAAWAAAAAL